MDTKQGCHVGRVLTTATFSLGGIRIGPSIFDFESFEVIAENKVDRTRHGVRTVYRGRAAGDDVNSLQHVDRNDIGRNDTVDVERRQALAVDQDQRTFRAEAAKVERSLTLGAVIDVLAVARDRDGHVAKNALDIRRLLEADFLFGDRRNRACRDDVLVADACSRCDDLFNRFVFGLLLSHHRGTQSSYYACQYSGAQIAASR